MSDLPAIACYTTSNGIRLYRIPMIVFPNGFVAYSYLVLNTDVPTLIDVGSGYGRSNDDLLAGIAAVKDQFGEKMTVQDIGRVIITHGHVDHFGGLTHLLEAAGGAKVGIHPLDRRVLTHYEERVIVATKNLTIYLQRAGVSADRLPQLLEMYGFSKRHFRSVNVDFVLQEGDTLDGMQVYHVPGHCSGQIALKIDDILISADHILPRTSPHLAAESITHYTGAGHYLESLQKVLKIEGIRLTLGGHEDLIDDVYGRVRQLQERLEAKLERILDIIRSAEQPVTISAISKAMYNDRHGFDVLLALQETGAYVEYLYDRGYLAIANLDEFEHNHNPALLYSVLP